MLFEMNVSEGVAACASEIAATASVAKASGRSRRREIAISAGSVVLCVMIVIFRRWIASDLERALKLIH